MAKTVNSKIAENIADRLHISVTARSVCRAVYRALRKSVRRSPEHRRARRALYRCALKRHADNRKFYQHVMRRRCW